MARQPARPYRGPAALNLDRRVRRRRRRRGFELAECFAQVGERSFGLVEHPVRARGAVPVFGGAGPGLLDHETPVALDDDVALIVLAVAEPARLTDLDA